MGVLTLTPELIEAAKEMVNLPQYYQPSEEVIAQHIIFKEFIETTKWKSLPKIIFYILLEKAFGGAYLKDAKGNLGFKIKLVEGAATI